MRIYAPKTPFEENGRLKVITYLHGFSLCLPEFYEEHLQELVTNGYYVFFPDFQKSDYPDFLEKKPNCSEEPSNPKNFRKLLLSLGVLLIKLILRREINGKELKQLAQDSLLIALRLILGSLLFVVFVNVINIFDRKYAKNLVSMIITVLASLRSTPMEWLGFAVNITSLGWEKLSEYSQEDDNLELDLSKKEIDFYLFGHSLGGLLALSWPYYLKHHPDEKLEKFYPQQIITGDPAPNTTLGIPKIALWILGIFRFPFATQPLKIEDTGTELKIPVGILHGNDDKIVKPTEWVKPPRTEEKGAFFNIVSDQKNIYFSISNQDEKLTANHNQSVTNTCYYANGFMSKFGGAKQVANAYNYQYIWPALMAIIKGDVKANELSNNHGFELRDFQVVDEPIRSNKLFGFFRK